MSADFDYTQHPRAAERAAQGPPTVRSVLSKLRADSGRVNGINQKIGLGITKSVGTINTL
ncbi:hypothetical protein [Cryobacterium sp. 10C3]|uniref:hypothetical protein n=1 Tax=Cryobacterium sp. 10C3 TaxID=3048577 RepID=UPI002AB4CFA1|nr:hypothetical protein [Cryobacterium sp. 10C3]MDY7557880.1 hypothetical protein [Cryobacterium sp. 10C3]